MSIRRLRKRRQSSYLDCSTVLIEVVFLRLLLASLVFVFVITEALVLGDLLLLLFSDLFCRDLICCFCSPITLFALVSTLVIETEEFLKGISSSPLLYKTVEAICFPKGGTNSLIEFWIAPCSAWVHPASHSCNACLYRAFASMKEDEERPGKIVSFESDFFFIGRRDPTGLSDFRIVFLRGFTGLGESPF